MTDFIPIKQSKEDLQRQFNCIKQIENYNIKGQFAALGIGLLVITAFVLLVYLLSPSNSLIVVKAVFSGLALFGWVVAVPIIIYLLVKRLRTGRWIGKAVEEEMASGKQYEVCFDEDGITYRSPNFTTTMKWAHFIGYMETPSTLFLFTKEWLYSFVALSAGEIGAENVEKLKVIVRDKLPLLNKNIKLRERL